MLATELKRTNAHWCLASNEEGDRGAKIPLERVKLVWRHKHEIIFVLVFLFVHQGCESTLDLGPCHVVWDRASMRH